MCVSTYRTDQVMDKMRTCECIIVHNVEEKYKMVNSQHVHTTQSGERVVSKHESIVVKSCTNRTLDLAIGGVSVCALTISNCRHCTKRVDTIDRE